MIFTFGTFEFDDQSTELRKNGRAIALEPQPAKALGLLLTRSGEVVSREELRDAVWGKDTHVDFDRGIAYCISQVRGAIGDSGENPRFVQTVPRRGFKFIAPVASASARPLPGELRRDLAGAAVGREGGPLQAPHPMSVPPRPTPYQVIAAFAVLLVVLAGAYFMPFPAGRMPPPPNTVVIGVSIFDNETGVAEYDRPVAGLSDLVVEHLTKLDPVRIAVIGNAAILRQPRNIRNLQAVAKGLKADYVLLGQLQRGESGLRFITHVIRLADEKHLRANRLEVSDPALAGLEAAVVREFDRAVRQHVLNQSAN